MNASKLTALESRDEHPQPNRSEQLAITSRNGKTQLPFWISPWSIGRNADGQAYHKCTVAHSRSTRHQQHVDITVLDESLRDIPHKERQRVFAAKIVEALQALGIVKPSQPATV